MAAPRKPKTPSGARKKKSDHSASTAAVLASPAQTPDPPAIAADAIAAVGASNGIAFEAIQRRAYELYLRRGATPGGDLADWLAAERELKARSAAHD